MLVCYVEWKVTVAPGVAREEITSASDRAPFFLRRRKGARIETEMRVSTEGCAMNISPPRCGGMQC